MRMEYSRSDVKFTYRSMSYIDSQSNFFNLRSSLGYSDATSSTRSPVGSCARYIYIDYTSL